MNLIFFVLVRRINILKYKYDKVFDFKVLFNNKVYELIVAQNDENAMLLKNDQVVLEFANNKLINLLLYGEENE